MENMSMVRDTASIIRAFDHLIEMLEEAGLDPDVLGTVESAKEMFEEELQEAGSFDDDYV
jgi:hypothetical protein